jgi:hypothetical protein
MRRTYRATLRFLKEGESDGTISVEIQGRKRKHFWLVTEAENVNLDPTRGQG